MPDLTLEQVREAGRFAENFTAEDLDWWTRDGVTFIGGYTESDGEFEEVDMARPGDDAGLPSNGWLHEYGCDCPHCI